MHITPRKLALLLAVHALFPVLTGCANLFLLHPSTHAIPTDAARREIPWQDGTLEVWTVRSPGANAQPTTCVLAFGGNGDRAEYLLQRVRPLLHGRSYELWAINYPGYGSSTGPARLHSIAESALVAADAMREFAGDRPVLVWGESLGTTAALHVAAEREVAGVVLRNPPPLSQLILGRYGWWNLWLFAWPTTWNVPEQLESLDTAPHATEPALFVTAQADGVVPPDYQRMVFDAYAGPKRSLTVPGGHNGGLDRDSLRAVVAELDLLWGAMQR